MQKVSKDMQIKLDQKDYKDDDDACRRQKKNIN
jgi:hypothetical protein